jgi:hypothetical protein
MLAAQARQIERTLWSLMRSHTERAVLVRRLAAQEPSPGRAAELLRRAAETERDAELVRRLIRERATTAIAEGPEDDTG